jgi:NAD(P)-dependent dehydrogenase (short-subunit alcohol dehydrogenase family)
MSEPDHPSAGRDITPLLRQTVVIAGGGAGTGRACAAKLATFGGDVAVGDSSETPCTKKLVAVSSGGLVKI